MSSYNFRSIDRSAEDNPVPEETIAVVEEKEFGPFHLGALRYRIEQGDLAHHSFAV